MIHLYTGNGKGKTTAALGLALRAVGDGKRVFMIQFIKGPWPSGEDKSHTVFGENFVLVKGGKGFVGILNDTLPRSEHEEAARKTLERAEIEIEIGKWDIVILDEVNVACDLKLISVRDVIDVVGRFSERDPEQDLSLRGSEATEVMPKADQPLADNPRFVFGSPRPDPPAGGSGLAMTNKKPELIILTGRGAPKEFYEIADLITEMREIKHYYNEGQVAKRGVEF